MLTVALISHSPHVAGAERMLLNLACLLQRSGQVEPVVLVPGPGPLLDELRQQRVRYELIRACPWYLSAHAGQNEYRRGVQDATRHLQHVLGEIGPDVVFLNTLTSVGGLLASMALDLPTVLWAHGILDSCLVPGRDAWFNMLHDTLLVRGSSRVVAVSEWTRRYFAQHVGRADIDLIYNWTECSPGFRPRIDKYCIPRLLCLNYFRENKGHDTLIAAADRLQRRGLRFEMDLYGAGELEADVRAQCARLGLQGVRFPGITHQVNEAIDSALCLVQPSNIESFGMTIIEAMARATPVISARSGGPEETIEDEVNGFLVDREDPQALADRIERLLRSPDLAADMGAKGHARVLERFSEEPAARQFLPLLENLARDFPGYGPDQRALGDMYGLFLKSGEAGAAPVTSAPSSTEPRSFAETTPPARSAGVQPQVRELNAPPLSHQKVARRVRCRLFPRQSHWRGLGVLVGTHQRPLAGTLTLKVHNSEGRLLRTARVDLETARDNDWLEFGFDPIGHSDQGEFTVELSCQLTRSDSLLSLFECSPPARGPWQRARRKFWPALMRSQLTCRLAFDAPSLSPRST